MRALGAHQNRGNQDAQRLYHGNKAQIQIYALYKRKVRMSGTPKLNMGYLGNRYHPEVKRADDRQHRLNAGRAGWNTGRTFWISKAPLKKKRTVIRAICTNSIIAGQACKALEQTDSDTNDQFLLSKARIVVGEA